VLVTKPIPKKRNHKNARLHRRALSEALENRVLLSTLVVNSILDQVDPSGSSIVTLRDAITTANAATTPTAITFNPTVFSSMQTITLNGTRLVIENATAADTITITGPTAGVTINGNNASGDFVIAGAAPVTLNGLTITGGNSGNGGGIDCYANVNVNNCTITGNTAPNGGGVFNSGYAHFLDCTISNNSGTTGGGLWNMNGGYADVTNVTVVNNTATYGGGFYNGGGGGTLTAALILRDATVVNNTAGTGGGILNYTGAALYTANDIIANNSLSGSSGTGPDAAGAITSRGYNLISKSDGSTGWQSTDITGTIAVPVDPLLGALGNNGGPTQTIVPQTGSPALGVGSVPLIPSVTTDQRGLPRTVNGLVDLGAVEVQPGTITGPVAIGPGSTTSPGPVLTTLTPTFSWSAASGITGMTGYQVYLSDITAAKSTSYNVGTSVTSYTLPSGVLTAGDKYSWTVHVVEGSQSGPSSSYMFFQAPPAVTLPAPVVIGPGSTTTPGTVLTTLTPTFTWNAVTGVTGMTGFQLNMYDTPHTGSSSYTIDPTATSFTLPSGVLTAGDAYVWNLRVVAGTQSGPPSTYLNFQAPPAVTLPAPVTIGPGSTTTPGTVLTTLTPTFTWNAVTGVTGMTGYQLSLYDTTHTGTANYTIDPTATSFTLPSGVLAAGDSYVWFLRVVAGTQTGPRSAYLNFQAPPGVTLPAPVATAPGSTTSPGPVLTTLTPTFEWSAVTGVTGMTGYQIYLSDITAAKSTTYSVGASVTSYTPTAALTAGDKYSWTVHIVVGTQSGPSSSYMFFQAPPAVTLPAPVVIGPGSTPSPGPVLTTSTPTFTWNAVTGVTGMTGYQLNLYDTTHTKSASYTIDPTATSFTLPAGVLSAGDTYVWNLRVVAGTQSGPPSTYLFFQAPPDTAPPAISGITPRTGSTLGGTVVTIIGTGFTGATAVTFGTVSATSFTVNSATSITATAPAQGVSVVDIHVTTPIATSASTTADLFSFAVPPPISFASPVSYTIGTANSPNVGNVSQDADATGDFNGDGKTDLAVVHSADNTVNILLGNGDGTFQPAVSYASGITGAIWVTVADVNGDGKQDLLLLGTSSTTGAVGVLLGNGDGTFKPSVAYGTGGGIRGGVSVGDFNGDGKLDLVAVQFSIGSGKGGAADILLGNGDGTFQPFYAVDVPYVARAVTVGDFNKDGKLDLAVAEGEGYNNVLSLDAAGVIILQGNGDGTFTTGGMFNAVTTPDAGSDGNGGGDTVNPEEVTCADLNGDGKLDLVESLYDHNVAVFIGNGDGTFQPSVGYATGEYPRPVAIADMNGDGKLDLVVCNIGLQGASEPGSVAVLLGNGDGTFQTPIQYTPFNYAGWLTVGDFNGDALPDIAVTRVSDGHSVNIMLNTTVVTKQVAAIAGATPDISLVQGQTYIEQVYQQLLNRPADPTGIAAWTAILADGGTLHDVVMGIVGSREYDANVVDGFYVQYLGRHAETAGLNDWVNLMQSGLNADQIRAGILGSNEYFAICGGTASDFIAALYTKFLNRTPDPTGLAAWTSQLGADPQSREAVSSGIANSDETRQDLVDSYYVIYLHRSADPTGLAAWMQNLANGVSEPVIVAAFLTSSEFLGDAGIA
jgi:hypothetical protein